MFYIKAHMDNDMEHWCVTQCMIMWGLNYMCILLH